MELIHPDSARALERENRELREELRKRAEQQTIMEQIVGNVSSLLDGSTDAMCIFDKDGYFLHINNACRRMLGLMDNHSTRLSIFDVYSPRDRDRVIREFFSKGITRWSGPITFHNKHTGFENTVVQTIEALSSKLRTETVFFKSYFTPQNQDNVNDKIRIYADMITHMPHGVGIWRLERGHTTGLRLACANKLASQYVGAPLVPGSLVHEILPNGPGLEVS
jgi:PAS domain-containing protein